MNHIATAVASNHRHKLLHRASAVLLLLLAWTATSLRADESPSTWTKKSFAVKGTWSLIEEGGTTYLVLDEAFSTRNAPDLKLFLSPSEGAALNGKNATRGAVLVAKLESNKGGQRYALPAGTNLSDFKTLALHCEKYSKLWAVSDLP